VPKSYLGKRKKVLASIGLSPKKQSPEKEGTRKKEESGGGRSEEEEKGRFFLGPLGAFGWDRTPVCMNSACGTVQSENVKQILKGDALFKKRERSKLVWLHK